MNIVVVGYGSIGARHVQILQSMGMKVAVVSRRAIDFPNSYTDLESALIQESPEYVLIANKTSEHRVTLKQLADLQFTGTVLIEKPLFHDTDIMGVLPFRNVFVLYNLRFHPIIQRVKDILTTQKPKLLNVYVGQYLPTWRPLSEVQTVYSSHKSEGGGVLRDLSHELDYITWLVGSCKQLMAMGGRFGNITVDSDDAFTIVMQTELCPMVTLHMNYFDRIVKREIIIQTEEITIHGDLVNNRLKINDVSEEYNVQRNEAYQEQFRRIFNQEALDVCTFREGLEVIQLFESCETASKERMWINYA